MFLSKVKINNFRLLKETTLNLKKDLSLLIGKNNSGKTSFLVLFQKFYNQSSFNFDDFSTSINNEILNINEETNIFDLSIKMILEIEYLLEDNLEHLSELILDLDPEKNKVKILFEQSIDKIKLLKDLDKVSSENKKNFIRKNLSEYLNKKTYIFEDYSDLKEVNRWKLIEKDINKIKNVINCQVIHAKRDVASSEAIQNKGSLSKLTTNFYNEKNKTDSETFIKINNLITKMDSELDSEYSNSFNDFLNNSKEFLNLGNLRVVSDLKSNELLSNSSRVVYGLNQEHLLPEHLNGLGYMNILYLLLDIEIKKSNFKDSNKDINLLFIEEPEAHTHPQLQYIFAKKVKELLRDDKIKNFQTIITTHSAHIVSECNFKDIRYMKKNKNENTEIIDFYKELGFENGSEELKFLAQYLTIHSSELFFASKIIFIEGITEKMLLPYFINIFDSIEKKDPNYTPISSQNITVLEVGANAKAFKRIIEILGIKALIITDIDTTLKKLNDNGSPSYVASEVSLGEYTSNATIKSYLNAPDLSDKLIYSSWMEKLKNNQLKSINENVKVVYQLEENNYHGRSFEDAFININLEKLKNNRDKILGLKNKKKLDENLGIFQLTESILDKKSDFASSLLYLGLTAEEEWVMPSYIKEGLEWISK